MTLKWQEKRLRERDKAVKVSKKNENKENDPANVQGGKRGRKKKSMEPGFIGNCLR